MAGTRRRQPVLVALALALVAIMATGVGVNIASADPLARDKDPEPINLGDMKFPMSRQDARFIANQLKPVKRHLPKLKAPRPNYPDMYRPRVNADPWLADNPARAQRYKLGDVMDIRESLYTQIGFPGVRSYQIRYRSTDSRGYPMIASAMLMIPLLATPNKNVFVWNQPINGSGADCGVTAALNRPSTGSFDTVMTELVTPVLQLGYPVLMPDGMGPRNSYAINRMSSHIVLDAMRMVHKQKKFELSQSKFVVMGISHGGLMTGYAAVEQGSYAPDLTKYINQFIIHEGAPDLLKLAQQFGLYGNLQKVPSPYGGFFISFLTGAVREYADKVPLYTEWMNEWGRANFKIQRSTCLPFNLQLGSGQIIPTYFKDGFFESKTFRTMMQIAKDNSMMYYPGLPKVPVLLIHGSADEILYQNKEDEYLYKKWCRAGVNAVYQEIPLGDHFSTVGLSSPRVVAQVLLSLNDVKQTPMCGGKVII